VSSRLGGDTDFGQTAAPPVQEREGFALTAV